METPLGEFDHLADSLTKWQIGGLYEPRNVVLGLHVIVIVVILTDVKETVAFQTIRRMHLKAKAYILHNL